MKNQLIPINYQYHLSSFVYRTIEASDSEYSKWLHEKGFESGKKKFKLFTFSSLRIPKYRLNGSTMEIQSDKMDLIVSMLSDKTIEHFIIGMFENQRMKIYDNVTEAEFYITTVESLPLPEFKECMRFKTLSPIIISKRIEHKGKESEYYMNPDDEDYFEYLKRNIKEKYIAYCLQSNTKINDYKLENFKLLNKYRSKLITIKEGMEDETQVRAYNYNFEISGDPEFLKFAYTTGFGKMNSLGFGCVEVKE